MKREHRIHVVLLAVLLLLNVAVKMTLWIQTPQTFPDSLGYVAPALRLLDGLGYGSQENGFRTPTYPLFIAAIVAPFSHDDLSSCREARIPACLGEAQKEPGAEANLRAIVAAQIVLGLLTIALVYGFAWQVARNAWVAALSALTYPIDLSTGYWEISILTDTLTTFLLMLAVVLTLLAAKATRHRLALHIALGVVLAALALAHSVYLLYAIIPVAFLWLKGHSPPFGRPTRPPSALVLLIPAFFIVAWSARNYIADGYFTPSTISGYNLTQMVGAFMEQAPAEYRDLAEIYLGFRVERIAARGSHSGTIFFVYRDMLAERETTWAGLSQMLTAMSLQMIREHPLGYLRVAWDSFQQFWKFGLGRQNYQLPISFDWVKWFLDTRVHQAWMALFFLTPIALAFLQLARRADTSATVWIWFAIATVFYAALFSSAFNFGDNERYRTHVARLQYTAVIATMWLLAKQFIRESHESRELEKNLAEICVIRGK